MLLFLSYALAMLLLGAALTIAWAKFGRDRHAALWAGAFYAVACSYALIAVALASPARRTPIVAVADIFAFACSACLAWGFRVRSGRHGGVSILVAWIVPALAMTALFVPLDQNWLRIVPTTCNALLCVMSAIALRAGPRPNDAAARATFLMLIAFAALHGVCAILAMRITPDRPEALALFRTVALHSVPVGMTGLGLFMMLLIASDLAERLHRLAAYDPLTGVLNRRGIEAAAARLVAQSVRQDRPLALAIADLDRFKSINDRFGHSTGDAVLRCFARHCEAIVRTGDVVGRLGGEEFVVLMAGATTGAAAQAVDRLRAELPAALDACGLPGSVTASFGIAALEGRGDGFAAMLERADAALYGSKDDGRDRVTLASDGGRRPIPMPARAALQASLG